MGIQTPGNNVMPFYCLAFLSMRGYIMIKKKSKGPKLEFLDLIPDFSSSSVTADKLLNILCLNLLIYKVRIVISSHSWACHKN